MTVQGRLESNLENRNFIKYFNRENVMQEIGQTGAGGLIKEEQNPEGTRIVSTGSSYHL